MPAGSTWSKSRSACCAVSAWIAESTTPTASSAKSPHGRNNGTPPAHASNGCSQPKKPAPKWAAPIPSRPKSHNHCAEVLVEERDYILDAHFAAGDYELFPEMARKLAQAGARVILVNTIASTRAAQNVTPPVPVVMLAIN